MEVFLRVLKWSAVAGAAALAVLALKPALDRRYSPRWRYWLFLALALALLLAPVRWSGLLPERPEPLVTVEVPELELAVGGGAGVMKRFGGLDQKNISYIEDVKANAKGYEMLGNAYLAQSQKKRKIG